MIDALLPAGVAWSEAYGDRPDEAVFPGEEAMVARAVGKRRREFVTARRCARQAMSRLGVPPQPILATADREPLWPAGVVGSITHCEGYRAAAVASARTFAAVGIDAEPHESLPDGVLDLIGQPVERDQIARLGRSSPATCWDRLLFSAKEAVFKAWYPLTGVWLDFDDADLAFSPGEFSARLLKTAPRRDGGPPPAEFAGRWLVRRSLVLTVVTVAHH